MNTQLTFRPYLIQRLNPPHETKNEVLEHFSFGGAGYKNGGLSDKAMDLLRPHFSYDYMGAAEFEFGDLPKSLATLAKQAENKQAVAKILDIKATPPRKKDPKKKGFYPAADSKKDPVHVKIYVIASSDDHMETIQSFLEAQTITDDYGCPIASGFNLKEEPRIWEGLMIKKEREWSNTIGGIDIQNAWMWFAREETFNAMCELLGLKPS